MKAEEAATLTFDQLVTHFRSFIRHIRVTYYVPNMGVEDVEQEALIVMWRCYQQVQEGGSLTRNFEAYMRQAVINRLIDLSRHASRQPKQTLLEDASVVPSDNSRQAYEDVDITAQLDTALLTEDAKLLLNYVMTDRRDYRDAFVRQVGRTRYMAVQRYNAARQEIADAMNRSRIA